MAAKNALWISVIVIEAVYSIAPSPYGCATQRPTTVLLRTDLNT